MSEAQAALSGRKIAIVGLLAKGRNCHEIAQTLGIAVGTVYEHIEGARRTLRARTTPELVRLAIHRGFIDSGN